MGLSLLSPSLDSKSSRARLKPSLLEDCPGLGFRLDLPAEGALPSLSGKAFGSGFFFVVGIGDLD